MSVVQPPPHLMQLAQTQVALTPDDVDLQGGRLIDVVEEEEIDATDGCRVQVITYRIESADGTEQLTKTIRRKAVQLLSFGFNNRINGTISNKADDS
ncbi:unnamed protein product [Nippostrongylus brasiliensis]|uniref:UPF0029 domain-containing protein n=1 Tax=Nippostrongylus brasiliensis TaxID=27835 RepID=A0A0N4Y875_NIPBR|nr:unnamed protein product [Nippostrongylus brasiliensis]